MRIADYLTFSGSELVVRISVARVQPRIYKGITDLLLPQTSIYLSYIVSLRN